MPKFITPVDVTPTTDGTYQDVDITSNVGSDAGNIALAIVLVTNLSAFSRNHSIRKNGGADDRYNDLEDTGQSWQHIGVDATDIFEARLQDSNLHIWLLGYWTLDEAANFTNAVDVSLASVDTENWQDIDISGDTGATPATAVMLEVQNIDTQPARYGIRENGSTDARNADMFDDGDKGGVTMGVDVNEIFEGTIEDVGVNFFMVGYATDNITTFANAKAYAENTTTGSYVDVDFSTDIPASNTGAFCQFYPADGITEYSGALRKNGETGYDQYRDISDHGFPITEIDTDRIAEQKIQNTGLDLWLWGYSAEPVAGVTITVPLGTFTFSGKVPSVAGGASVAAPLKTYTFAGQVPAVGTGAIVAAPLGTFTLTGLLPSVSALGPPDPERTIAIRGEPRTFTVIGESRTVEADHGAISTATAATARTATIFGDSRTVTIPGDDRTVSIPKEPRTVEVFKTLK